MARFFFARPRSVNGLLLASFGLVALPLVAAVVFSAIYVDRLAEQSQRLVLQGVAVTRNSRLLADIVTDMERNARQYAVLGDASLAQSFQKHHAEFERVLAQIKQLQLASISNTALADMRGEADEIARAIAAKPPDIPAIKQALALFAPLRAQIAALTEQGNAFIDEEVAGLKETSGEARRFMLISTFALIPAVIILVLLFTWLISRPIHQIGTAIRRLGEGNFEQPIAISAPSAELDAVAAQLDWMRRRLAELESEKNQFLRQMSHELKTPLASIREGVELLRDGSLGDVTDQQQEVIEIVQENSLELLALIENLLNFAAWQQHRSKLEYSDCNLETVASEVLKRHDLSIQRKQLRVQPHYERPHLRADHDQIRLLFDNLVTNAIKYSPQGGRLKITIATADGRAKDTLLIAVYDDGPGIPAQDREQVFHPFYQSSVPARAHVKGSGIGLSVAREVVRAHGGSIQVAENNETHGACLQARLPISHGDT